MLAALNINPLMPIVVGAAFAILVLGPLLRRVGQPQVVAYLLAGVLLGPFGVEMFTDQATIAHVGDVGVILLLFFLGMEMSLDELVKGWKVAIGGTLLQIGGSVAIANGLADGPDRADGVRYQPEQHGRRGRCAQSPRRAPCSARQDALSVLLVQDVAIAPMLIAVGLLAGNEVVLQVVGAVRVVALGTYLARTTRVVPSRARLRPASQS